MESQIHSTACLQQVIIDEKKWSIYRLLKVVYEI